ncbi:MAG: phospholipase D-like domain-containing protein [Pseudomonadota bacterium]
MRADEIARRLDSRAGYELVTYREVGLPLYSIHATALVEERHERSCIEEFSLRALAAGLGSLPQVQGLLGLPEKVVQTTLADLVRQEAIKTGNGGEQLSITDRGRELLEQAELSSPTKQTIWFPFDGLLRRPKWFGNTAFLRPNELKEQGQLAIRAIPARPPEKEELSPTDVTEVVSLASANPRGQKHVLRLETIEKRYRVFVPAIALIYRALEGSEIQVGFAIDGRLSHEHELAFARGGGLEHQTIVDDLNALHAAVPSDGPMAARVSELVEEASALRRDTTRITTSRSVADRAAVARATARTDAERANAISQETEAQRGLSEAEAALRGNAVRPVPVYEHPAILEEALETARERLLIISPWIRRAVVNDHFVRRLERACARGVRISLGFGLGDVDEGEKPWDAQARGLLESLAASTEQFQMKRLGNTHAKVLIKDAEFFVITSFNWLSFRGDPSKPFRDEWGTMVRDPPVVEEYYVEMMKRFV